MDELRLWTNRIRTAALLVLLMGLTATAMGQSAPTSGVGDLSPNQPTAFPAGQVANPTPTPIVNRYATPPIQPSRPASVPFDPEVVRAYQAIDLPPPGPTPPSINPAPSSMPTASPLNRFPGAAQMLPRIAGTSSNPPEFGQAGSFPSSKETFSAAIPPLPGLPGVSSGVGTFLTGFSNQSEPSIEPKIISNLWNAKLVAVVGTERVLAGDMAAVIEPIIEENSAKLLNKKQENEARMMLVRQLLPQYVEMKAMQQEFFRDIAGNIPPRELQKKQEEVMTRASKEFYDRFVPLELYRKYQVETLADLEQKLQEQNLTIGILKNHFLMQILAMQLEDKYVAHSFDASPSEILAFYEENAEKWKIPARAKWRELTVRFDKHPDRSEADQLIKQMGNEVVLGGKPFEAVARDSSEGFTAAEGGVYDWTSKGSLKSSPLDQALFTLPLGRLSQIIEDDMGLHIIEVTERDVAKTQDMHEIQDEIRKKFSREKRQEKLKEFRQQVMERIPVWTLWPEDIPGSRALDQILTDEDEQ